MTAKELLNTGDTDFLCWLGLWAEHKEVPMPFIDWLTERGMEQQAKAAQWAYEMPYRPSYAYVTVHMKPFPIESSIGFAWWLSILSFYADALPLADKDAERYSQFKCIEEALCYLLDNVKGDAK